MRPIRENVVLFQVEGKDNLETLNLRKDVEALMLSRNLSFKKVFKKEKFTDNSIDSILTYIVRETDFDNYLKHRLTTSDQFLVLDQDRIAFKVTIQTGNKQKLGQFRAISPEMAKRTKCLYYDAETDTSFTTAISEL